MITLRAAVLVLLAPGLALANGYSVPNVNPRDLALSASAIAAQRDAAAVYAEPAALARLEEGLHIAAVAGALDITTKWSAPQGPADATTKFRLAPPGGAFAAYATKIHDTRVALGAGFTIPFGGNVFWDDGWAGRFSVTTVDRKVYGMYLNGAFEAGPRLRLGGGLVYYRTTEYVRQGLDFATTEGYAEVSASGGAPAFEVSAEFQPADTVRVAFDYKHQAVQHLKGDAAFHGVPDAIRPSLPDQSVEHTLTIPSLFELGASWQAREDVLVTAAWTFLRYSIYREDRFVGSAGTTVVVPRNYDNGYTIRAGAEYRLTPAVELRVGAERDVSGGHSATFSPSLPDASSWAGSVGAGWHLRPNLTVDAAFFLSRFDRVTASGAAFPGKYDIYAWIASAGFTWRTGLLR
jgi:long-chain fatty acid transport protein